MNPYETFVTDVARIFRQANDYPLGGFPAPARSQPAPDAPRALIFAPHPDDEVIIGGLPLRLLRERKWNVINVAVTQGSNRARQPQRWKELEACCNHIGFTLRRTRPNGLEGINLRNRKTNPQEWNQAVDCLARILSEEAPRVIFFPHDDDWNSTHIGTHHLVVDALGQLGRAFSCEAVETEFWGAMDTPNLLVEVAANWSEGRAVRRRLFSSARSTACADGRTGNWSRCWTTAGSSRARMTWSLFLRPNQR